MSKLPKIIVWIAVYIVLAAVFVFAQKGDPYAQMAFPAIVCARAVSMIIVAANMNSSWWQPRSLSFASIRFAGEGLIVIALVVTGSPWTAVLAVLTVGLYEAARIRITPGEYLQRYTQH